MPVEVEPSQQYSWVVHLSSGNTDHIPDSEAQLSHQEIKSISISTMDYDQGMYIKLNIGLNELETMMATLEYCKVCSKWVP